MKDKDVALELLHAAKRRMLTVKRCQQLMGGDGCLPATTNGLKNRIAIANQQARMLVRAARMLHPATTPKGTPCTRPVPPKTGPAAVDFSAGFTLPQESVLLLASPRGIRYAQEQAIALSNLQFTKDSKRWLAELRWSSIKRNNPDAYRD